MIFPFSKQQSSSKTDETENDVDSHNGRKIYNLTDILSTPSSGFYKYERHQQKKQPYEQHYTPPVSSEEKPKTKERYYIYSHTKVSNDDAEEINQADKSRKARSSPMSDRKQVSRNISMVLENLLMSYENSQLPTHGEGLCVKIYLLNNIKFMDFLSFFFRVAFDLFIFLKYRQKSFRNHTVTITTQSFSFLRWFEANQMTISLIFSVFISLCFLIKQGNCEMKNS